MTAAILRTGKTDYNTPQWIVDSVREFFGGEIYLDPCSNVNSMVRAVGNIMLEDPPCAELEIDGLRRVYVRGNGLAFDWRGHSSVYINPPFGRAQARWVTKAASASAADPELEVILLLPANTDTRLWQGTVFPHADGICWIKGRIVFPPAEKPIPKGCAFVYFGPRGEAFVEHFSRHGVSYRPFIARCPAPTAYPRAKPSSNVVPPMGQFGGFGGEQA